MTYFAWDDFTPGPLGTATLTAFGGPDVAITFTPGLNPPPPNTVFLNNQNPAAGIRVIMNIGAIGGTCNGGLTIPVGTIFQGTATSSTSPNVCGEAASWEWDGTDTFIWNVIPGAGSHEYDARVELYDPIITSHFTQSIQQFFTYSTP
jgi:hypothetical protein